MLRVRVLTALVMTAVLVSAALLLDTRWMALLIGAVVFAAALEWARLAGVSRRAGRLLFGLLLFVGGLGIWLVEPGGDLRRWLAGVAVAWWAYVALALLWQQPMERLLRHFGLRLAAGMLTLIPAWYLLLSLHAQPDDGPLLMLYAMAVVWVADIGAYFAGRRFGHHKLAPGISPGKTVEGVVGGVLATALWGALGAVWLSRGVIDGLLFVALIVAAALFSVAGDLFESVLKRGAGVKDSGHLLPGHGGVLDRIDSLTAAIPVLVTGLILAGRLG